MTIRRITGTLPAGVARLQESADREGFRNVARLRTDWDVGVERFEAIGAALFGAFDDDMLVGVGGVTREPTAPGARELRVRRFYVDPEFRGRGHGGALVRAAIDHSRGQAELLLVHSHELAMDFWDRAGFARSVRPGITHERAL